MEDRRQVFYSSDMASDLSWSDLASDIVSESDASCYKLIALHQLVQARLSSEPALRARVVAKLCANMCKAQQTADAEDAALGLLVDIAVGLPCWRVATIRIQSAARGCAARRNLSNRISAVCALQRGARACARRRRVARAQRAATALQGVWRTRGARRAWLCMQRAARLLQATERLRRRRPLVRVMRRRAMAGAAQLAGARAESAALRVELATSHAAHGRSTRGARRLVGALLLLLLAAAGSAGVGALGRIATRRPVVTKTAVEAAVEEAVATATAAVGSAAAAAAAAAAMEAAAAGLVLAAAQQATAEARAGWAVARGEAEALRKELALQTRSARGTAVVRGRSRMVGRGQAPWPGEDGADEEGAEEVAEGGAKGANGANGAKGTNARQEEEEASPSARAVASKHGAARWLVRLTRHAASFWVQLVVARLEVLFAYGCGDDGSEAGGGGGGGGVVAPVCRQMRHWKTRLSARLSGMSGGKHGDEVAAGEGGGEASQEWPQKASEHDVDDNVSHAEKIGTVLPKVSAEEAIADRPAAALFNFLLGSV